MKTTQTYIPGVCNIGPKEMAYRRNVGYVGVAITLVLAAAFIAFDVNDWWRLVLFVPATLAASGLLQAYFHFCAKFGMSGLFNFSDDMTRQESVDQIEFRKQDRKKALEIIGLSVGIGLAVAIAAFLLA